MHQSPSESGIVEFARPWVERNMGCEVRAGKHGLSLVASRAFGQGDVILDEYPVMIGLVEPPDCAPEFLKCLDLQPDISSEDWAFALHVAYPSQASRPRGQAEIDFLLSELALYTPEKSNTSSHYAAILDRVVSSDEAGPLLKGLLLKKFTSLPCSGSQEGSRCLLALLCKCNHSCFPNSVCSWMRSESIIGNLVVDDVGFVQLGQQIKEQGVDLGFMQLKAVTQISPGEEITISYYGSGFSLKEPYTEKRRQILLDNFEFQCCCELCEPGSSPPSWGQRCKRVVCQGKPPPIPPGGLRKPPWSRSTSRADKSDGACSEFS